MRKEAFLLITIVAIALLVAGCGQRAPIAQQNNPQPAAPVQPQAAAPSAPAQTNATSDAGLSAMGTEINSLNNLYSDIDLSQLDSLDSDLALVS